MFAFASTFVVSTLFLDDNRHIQCDYELTRSLIRSLQPYEAQGISNSLTRYIFPLSHTSLLIRSGRSVLHTKLVLFIFYVRSAKEKKHYSRMRIE